jgi:hypothetical protein
MMKRNTRGSDEGDDGIVLYVFVVVVGAVLIFMFYA